NLGFSTSSSRQQYYLLRDRDTIALERLPEDTVPGATAEPLTGRSALSVAFGWQFRPVLNEKAVEGGTRQVYALLALPAGRTDKFAGTLCIHTHWRCYDASSNTAGQVIPGTCRDQPLATLQVVASDTLDKQIEPVVTDYWVSDLGGGQVLA